MGVMCHFVGGITYLFYEPILAPRVELDLGLRADCTFALMTIFYAIGCVIIGELSSLGEIRVTIFICFLMSAFAIYLSSGLEDDSIVATLFGVAGEGFFYAGQIVPVYGEVINVMQNQFESEQKEKRRLLESKQTYIDDSKIDNNITDKSCSLLGMAYAFGSIIGPVLGGALDDWYGFKLTVKIIALLQLSFSCLFFVLSMLPDLI